MSRTFAALELSISQNGNRIKTFTEDVSDNNGKEVTTLLNALQKTKESSNGFLTQLVEEDKAHGAEGVVISHSKRKHNDDGKLSSNLMSIKMVSNYVSCFSIFQMTVITNGKLFLVIWKMKNEKSLLLDLYLLLLRKKFDSL